LILGSGASGKRALTALRREPNLGYEVVGFVDDGSSKKSATIIDGIKVHRYLWKIDRYVENCDVQDIVIALTELDKDMLSQLVNRLQHKVKSVLYVPDFSGMAVIGTELRQFFHDQFFAVEIKNNLAQPLNYFIKKLFDYAVGLLLFCLLIIPIMLISALIRITSPGPAIYKQNRIGKNCKPFLCYKFRTMYKDADRRLKTILETDLNARAEWEHCWKLKNDPRVTKIGDFLRKTSLDEIPQIFNVLKGQMSLIGPRPVTQDEIVKYYKDSADLCFCVLPGITGLWQVSGRSNTSYDHRVSLDSWYVRNWNLWLDIVILMKTVYVVLKKEGAR
jgi:undecaprenyl-phosphate galactose phosphotransferase